MTTALPEDETEAAAVARSAFEREVGVSGLESRIVPVGPSVFLKFVVGRSCPLYLHALREVQHLLPSDNPFKGTLGLLENGSKTFASSPESSALLTLLTRSTREVAQGQSRTGFAVPYVPFHNREDHQLAQPATQVVYGRRGVGKSTLIRRACTLLGDTAVLVAVLDMQAYVGLVGDELLREVLPDVAIGLANAAEALEKRRSISLDTVPLRSLATEISEGELSLGRASAALRRAVEALTRATGAFAVVFLDDYHLVDQPSQPQLLGSIHGGLKGANGWLKVAGLKSLLNHYSAATRIGLQIPGDAQALSLDLTLEDPEAAESHLRAILTEFLTAVGYEFGPSVIQKDAFRRLVWANAGVPRDFLQMFARAVEHAQRNRHAAVSVSDVNIAIGEFGQRKADDLQRDARNSAGALAAAMKTLGRYCLEQKKVNAFLVGTDESEERRLVHILSDLRMAHLIHQSVTAKRAGERYEAYILDYSTFTGFRRRPGVREMVPTEAQFRAHDLKKLPRITPGFFAKASGPVPEG